MPAWRPGISESKEARKTCGILWYIATLGIFDTKGVRMKLTNHTLLGHPEAWSIHPQNLRATVIRASLKGVGESCHFKGRSITSLTLLEAAISASQVKSVQQPLVRSQGNPLLDDVE